MLLYNIWRSEGGVLCWAGKIFMYLTFMFLCLLMYTYFGIMSVALAASLTAANVISTTGYAIWNLMAGLILPLPVLLSPLYQSADPGQHMAFALQTSFLMSL